MKLYCDTTRACPETKLVDPEYYSFPTGRNAIQIIYRTGYKPEEMPENLKRATLEIVDWTS